MPPVSFLHLQIRVLSVELVRQGKPPAMNLYRYEPTPHERLKEVGKESIGQLGWHLMTFLIFE